MAFKHDIPIVPPPERRAGWFALQEGDAYLETLGFREAPGGVHLSKTMMLAELIAVMDAMPARGAVKQAVLVDNVLGKGTGAARRLALSRLNTLYGILTPLESIRIPGVSGDGRPESVNLTG